MAVAQLQRMAAGLAVVSLCGCAVVRPVGSLADRALIGGYFGESRARKANEAAYRLDLKTCAGSGAAAEWCRLGADDRNMARMGPNGAYRRPISEVPVAFVYDDSLCAGAVIGGRCQGKIIARPAPPAICHGQMIDGSCTGPTY